MKLTDRFEDYFYLGDTKIDLNMSFDNVLRSFELMKDASFSEYEKLMILMDMFVLNDLTGVTIDNMLLIWQTIQKHFIFDGEIPKENEEQEKVFDLEMDANYIYASFMYDYKIDLFEQQGILNWKKFQSLLGGLSKHSKLSEVISIRSMEIPKVDEVSRSERLRIIRLKEVYELKLNEEEQKKQTEIKVKALDNKLNDFASRFKRKGVK